MPNRIVSPEALKKLNPKLPSPWVHIAPLASEEQDALESIAGSAFSLSDLSEEEKTGRIQTRRAMEATRNRWVEIRNTDNELRVYLRLQGATSPEEPPERVTSVVVPFQTGKDLTGADLRSIPVQALTAAYSAHKLERDSNLLMNLLLAGSLSEDPLSPLPPATAEDSFHAKVARQYRAFQDAAPTQNPIDQMAQLNGAAKSSVQRWVTRARRRGLLPPATQGKRDV